ncbi:MAG TPA: NADH-quinone oxidoreductase subunit C [Steroidobacteraceae bacterium]|nr:NADH-quinone oxidoreductase subunit C [Steroidobacteraceae bacterium]
MTQYIEQLTARIEAQLPGRLTRRPSLPTELSYDVPAADLTAVATALRDDSELRFEILIDVAGVDYLDYGRSEWRTVSSSSSGFGRGVNRAGNGGAHDGPRFAVLYQLLSVSHNQRLTLRAFCIEGEEPTIDSLVGVYASANWFEREAFDLFGIVFNNHPDLRRILTDYGFIGHPFRKDFPLVGNVEVRYDADKQRVVYEPVQITERILVPRVIRDDHRYDPEIKGRS